MTRTVEEVITLLWREGSTNNVYAVIDCAVDDRLYPFLSRFRESTVCLFAGPIAPELRAVAPYLVQLENNDQNAIILIRAMIKSKWGLYITSELDLNSLSRKIRHFMQVILPDGRVVLFRWYDFRVLKVYWSTCSDKQKHDWPAEFREIFSLNEKIY